MGNALSADPRRPSRAFSLLFRGPSTPQVGKRKEICRTRSGGRRGGWLGDSVWLDAPATKKGQPARLGTIGFRGVHEEDWNFHIGGHQVCEKWLKDRRGRKLSKEDIDHYQKIVVALNETLRIMQEIDEVIDRHGGWQEAFKALRVIVWVECDDFRSP